MGAGVISLVLLAGCASKNELELFHTLDQNRTEESRVVATRGVGESSYVYRFRPFDRISMLVYGQPEYSTPKNGVLIDRRGYATLPVIGRVKVAGLSEAEAGRKIQRMIRKYVVDAVVVAENPQKLIYVIGNVRKPGPVKLQAGRIAMLRAIGAAGGFSDAANRQAVYLVRKKGGQARLTRLSLSGEESLQNAYITLIPGDIVYVAPNTIKTVNMGPMQTLGIIGRALTPFASTKALLE